VQGAESTVVVGNTLSNTNTSTNTELLAPGAIGVTNASEVVITDNEIRDARFGIVLNDSNGYGLSTGKAVVARNRITNCTMYAIKSVQGRITVSGNQIDTCQYGYYASGGKGKATRHKNVVVEGNVIKRTSASGMSIGYVAGLQAVGNEVSSAGLHGISVAHASDISISNNRIVAAVERGIDIASSNTGAIQVSGNALKSCGVAAHLGAPTRVADNQLDSNKVNFTGLKGSG
jgi:parallel beta-helix repeat protein